MSSVREYATFRLHDLLFAVDAPEVLEVLPGARVTPVPLSPPEVAGLVNVRGQVVTALDLRRRLGLPAAVPGATRMTVLVRSESELMAFLVDEIGNVVRVREEEREAPPVHLDAALRSLVPGVYRLPEHLLHVLDVVEVSRPTATARAGASHGG